MTRLDATPPVPAINVEPAPIHHALDRLTVLTIQVQQLRKQLNKETPSDPEHIEQALAVVESELGDLSTILMGIRDQT